MNDIPRRARMDRWTPAEKAIWEAKQVVESIGGSRDLTDAVNLLNAAQDKVADHVEGNDIKYCMTMVLGDYVIVPCTSEGRVHNARVMHPDGTETWVGNGSTSEIKAKTIKAIDVWEERKIGKPE